jgi:hypothetical protein
MNHRNPYDGEAKAPAKSMGIVGPRYSAPS